MDCGIYNYKATIYLWEERIWFARYSFVSRPGRISCSRFLPRQAVCEDVASEVAFAFLRFLCFLSFALLSWKGFGKHI